MGVPPEHLLIAALVVAILAAAYLLAQRS